MSTHTKEEIIAIAKRHAEDHYNDADCCWDVIVECYTDEELAHALRGCSTPAEAIEELDEIQKIQAEQKRAQLNEVF